MMGSHWAQKLIPSHCPLTDLAMVLIFLGILNHSSMPNPSSLAVTSPWNVLLLGYPVLTAGVAQRPSADHPTKISSAPLISITSSPSLFAFLCSLVILWTYLAYLFIPLLPAPCPPPNESSRGAGTLSVISTYLNPCLSPYLAYNQHSLKMY